MKVKNLWGTLFLALTIMVSCSQEDVGLENNDSVENQSTTVSLEEARIELEKLLLDIDAQQTKSTISNKKIIADAFTLKLSGGSTKSNIETPEIHVFNFKNKGGFALMSGNREIPSLLALSDSGEITESDSIDNPGFALFLENMEEKYIDGLSVPTKSSGNRKVYGEWINVVHKQGGYCKVRWDQGSPYNKYCPLKDGVRTLTGCVATAVAQLMSIYEYPSSYNGYSFNWATMTAKASANNCSTEGQNQIARLMVELGSKSNLKMSYNTSVSGAKPENISRTLKNFGYTSGGSLKD